MSDGLGSIVLDMVVRLNEGDGSLAGRASHCTCRIEATAMLDFQRASSPATDVSPECCDHPVVSASLASRPLLTQ